MTRSALIVDDAATVRMYHRTILLKAGFEVAEAVNGYAGLEATLATTFSLLVVDINMPKMDGYSFVAAVRRGGVNQSTPVIMVSTEDSAADADRAYECGANMYLIKPVSAQQLTQLATMLTAEAV